ncbi:MAG: NAD-glutamate dehydrogenase [Rickettsiales bacterium]
MFHNSSIRQEILKQLPDHKNDDIFKDFLEAFFSYLPLDGDINSHIEDLKEVSIKAYKHFKKRENGHCAIDILPVKKQGEEAYNELLIANDDMPFLVDSLNELLYKRKYRILQMVNALFYVERDKEGRLRSVKSNKHKKANESFIYVRIAPIKSADSLKRLASEVINLFKSVRAAVSDWRDMVEKIQESSVTHSQGFDSEEIDFLNWLVNDNFTFIGYREYQFNNNVSKNKCEPKVKESLGVLKNVDANFSKSIIEDVFRSDQRVWREANITTGKIREVSKVHRYSSFDYVCVLSRDEDRLISARVFIGLFVTRLDYQSVTSIPIIRKKVNSIVERGGFEKSSFNGKELFSIVETLPRDELFQLSDDELFLTSMMILSCLNNPRLILFLRENRCRVFLNMLVFFPKSRVTSDIVDKITKVIRKYIPGKLINSHLKISSMNLSYVQVSMKVKDNRDLDIDVREIERVLDESTSLWIEKFIHYVEGSLRDDLAKDIIDEYKGVFPISYQNNCSISDAIEDIHHLEQLNKDKKIIFRVCKRENDLRGCINLKSYSLTNKIDLYNIMPILENLGFRAIEEKVYILDKKLDGKNIYIQDFILDECRHDKELGKVKGNLEDAILRVYEGDLKNDTINKLILNAALTWREVYLLSAYCKYLLQIKVPHSQEFIKHTLVKYPALTRKIVEYFYTKFEHRVAQEKIDKVRKSVDLELSKVLDNIEDKVFKKLIDVVDHTLRTNFFQKQKNGQYKKYISFKIDSSKIADIPLPVPHKEIFVYSSDVEGIHLRGGKVSRGGLRWSDHPDDYRNEVLGLMKAQMTKNSVIVPDGAKGGFVAKNIPELHSQDEIFAEGVKCYKTFLSGLLDITDNIVDGNVVSPANVVCYDDEDPYLVVAADKGTATFSDTANELAASYNFWLADAFASGGSAGYDHKKMGITARGAWVSVEEHFKVLDKDISKKEFTVIGIGDMSGDVFGNGMLLSKCIKLVAAFNHKHIFIDPNPNIKSSYKERERLFKKHRSQWSDYNESLISKGGGIFSRKSKSIPVSAEMCKIFDLDCESIDPDKLIKKILTSEVELLWNGGIGTYVKAENESNESVGDKPNDNLRVNGKDLRCKVIGEGGNLGFTQLGRIEFALQGGLVNTDFIDNSAGVDCSDHEVNIKIALKEALDKKKISLKERNIVLEKMKSEVASLVLEDNLYQNRAISISVSASIRLFETKVKLIEQLQESIGLRPELEYLPGITETTRRSQEKIGFTRPEIAVLLAYSKMSIYKNLIDSKLPEDQYFQKYLVSYFPKLMQKDFYKEINNHQLKREIITTKVSNHIANHIGSYFFHDAQDYTGLKGCDIARAYHIVWEIFGIEDLWNMVKEVPKYSDSFNVYYDIRSFMQVAIFWFLKNLKQPLEVEKAIQVYSKGIQFLMNDLTNFIDGSEKESYSDKIDNYKKLGLSDELSSRVASLTHLYPAMDIVDISNDCKISFKESAEAYFRIGQKFHYDWLIEKANDLSTASYWKRMLVKTIKDDIFVQRRELTSKILRRTKGSHIVQRIDNWIDANQAKVDIYNKFIHSIKCMEDIDSAKLVVSIKQGEVLI